MHIICFTKYRDSKWTLPDAIVHFEHVQIIRSDIGTESVEKCRDVQ
jgi:hypothetical protein